MAISRRFPEWQAVISVYAMIVLFVYGWTIYWILWKLPSWLYYLTVAEILLIVCYTLVVNLLESLAVIFGVWLLSLLLPRAWFAERFSSAGTLLSILLGAVLIAFSAPIHLADTFSYRPLIQMGLLFLAALALAIFLPRYPPAAKLLEVLADRARIFLYILLPLSAVSLIIVLVRNLIL